MPTEPLDKKFEAFGWHVIQIDGHDFAQIEAAYQEAAATKGQPTMILAHTVKGKGVSFMAVSYTHLKSARISTEKTLSAVFVNCAHFTGAKRKKETE